MIRHSLEENSVGAAHVAGTKGMSNFTECNSTEESFEHLSLAQLLCHSNWKARKQGWVSVRGHAQSSKSTALGHTTKATKEGNAVVQEEILAASVELLRVCCNDEQAELARGVLPLVFEKGLTGRPRAVDVSTSFVNVLVDHGHASLVFELMLPVFAHRTPKNRLAATTMCAQLIRDYGVAPFPVNLVVQKMQPLFNDVNSQVRKEAITLCCQCYRYIGAGIKSVLTDLRDVQMQELERQLDSVTVGSIPAKYVRGSESYDSNKAAQTLASSLLDYQASLVGTSGGNHNGCANLYASNDAFEQLPQKAVLSKLPAKFYEKALDKTVSWQDRCSFVTDTLLPLLAAPRFRAKDNYHELAVFMREYLVDCQAPVMLLGFKMIQECARGLRGDFAPHARQYLVILFDKMKDKKKSVLEHIMGTLETLIQFGCTTLDQCNEDMDLVSRSKNPSQRAALLQFCIRVMDKLDVTQYSKLAHDMTLLRRLVNDDKASNRDLAYVLLQKLIANVGEEVYEPVLRSMDEKQLVKMRAMRPCNALAICSSNGGTNAASSVLAQSEHSTASSMCASSYSHTTNGSNNNNDNTNNIATTTNSSTPSCSPAKKLARVESATAHDANRNCAALLELGDRKGFDAGATLSTSYPSRSSAAGGSAGAMASQVDKRRMCSISAAAVAVHAGCVGSESLSIDTVLPSRQETLTTFLGLLNGNTAVYDLVRSSEWAQRLDGVTKIKLMTDSWTAKQCNKYVGHLVVYLETYPGWRESTAQVFTLMLSTLREVLERATIIPVGVACALISGCAPRITDAKSRPLLRELCAQMARHVGVGLVMRQVMAVAMQIKTPRLLLESNACLASLMDDYVARVCAATTASYPSVHVGSTTQVGQQVHSHSLEKSSTNDTENSTSSCNMEVKGVDGEAAMASSTESLVLAEGLDVKCVVDYLLATSKEQMTPALRPSAVALLLKLRSSGSVGKSGILSKMANSAEAIIDSAMSNFAPAFQNGYWQEVHKSTSAAVSRSSSAATQSEEDSKRETCDLSLLLHPNRLQRLSYNQSSNSVPEQRQSGGSINAGLTGTKTMSSSTVRRLQESLQQQPASAASAHSSHTTSIRRQSSVTTSYRGTGEKTVPLACATAAHVAAVLHSSSNKNNTSNNTHSHRLLSNEESSNSSSCRVSNTQNNASSAAGTCKVKNEYDGMVGGFRLPLSSVGGGERGDRTSISMQSSFSNLNATNYHVSNNNNSINFNINNSSCGTIFVDESIAPPGPEVATSSQSPRVSVAASSEAPPSLKLILTELNRASDWRERLEAVHRIEDHIAHHHGTLSARAVAPVLQALSKRLGESNKNVLIDVLRVVMLSVEAAGYEASRMSFRAVLPGVLDLLGDQKASLREEARRVVELGVRVVGIEGMLPCLPKPLHSESALTRQSTLEVMATGFEAMMAPSRSSSAASLPRAVLQLLIAPLVRGLMDRVQEIRHVAERVLGYVMRILGPEPVRHYVHHQLKPADRFLVTPAVERQVLLGGMTTTLHDNEEQQEARQGGASQQRQEATDHYSSWIATTAATVCDDNSAHANMTKIDEEEESKVDTTSSHVPASTAYKTLAVPMVGSSSPQYDPYVQVGREDKNSSQSQSYATRGDLANEAANDNISRNNNSSSNSTNVDNSNKGARLSDRVGLIASSSAAPIRRRSSTPLHAGVQMARAARRASSSSLTQAQAQSSIPCHATGLGEHSILVDAKSATPIPKQPSSTTIATRKRSITMPSSASSVAAHKVSRTSPSNTRTPEVQTITVATAAEHIPHATSMETSSSMLTLPTHTSVATRHDSATIQPGGQQSHVCYTETGRSDNSADTAVSSSALSPPVSYTIREIMLNMCTATSTVVRRMCNDFMTHLAAGEDCGTPELMEVMVRRLYEGVQPPRTQQQHHHGLDEELAMSLLSCLSAVFSSERAVQRCHSGLLFRLFGMIFSCLLSEQFALHETVLKALNSTTLKLLQGCAADDVFSALLSRMANYSATYLQSGCRADLKYIQVTVKCIMRVNLLRVSPDNMILCCHEYLQQNPPSAFRQLDDLPIRTIKTVLQDMTRRIPETALATADRLVGSTNLVTHFIRACLNMHERTMMRARSEHEQHAGAESQQQTNRSSQSPLPVVLASQDGSSSNSSIKKNSNTTNSNTGIGRVALASTVDRTHVDPVSEGGIMTSAASSASTVHAVANVRSESDADAGMFTSSLRGGSHASSLLAGRKAVASSISGTHKTPSLATLAPKRCADEGEYHTTTTGGATASAGVGSHDMTSASSFILAENSISVLQQNCFESGAPAVRDSSSTATRIAPATKSDARAKKLALSSMSLPPALPHVGAMGREMNYINNNNEDDVQCRSVSSGEQQSLAAIFGRIRNHVTSSQGVHDLYVYLCDAPANYEEEFNHQLSRCSEAFRMYIKRKLETKVAQEGAAKNADGSTSTAQGCFQMPAKLQALK